MVVLDSPFGFQENAPLLAERLTRFFRTSFSVDASVASYRSPSDGEVAVERLLADVRRARYVFAGPGSPSYALRVWRGTGTSAEPRSSLDGALGRIDRVGAAVGRVAGSDRFRGSPARVARPDSGGLGSGCERLGHPYRVGGGLCGPARTAAFPAPGCTTMGRGGSRQGRPRLLGNHPHGYPSGHRVAFLGSRSVLRTAGPDGVVSSRAAEGRAFRWAGIGCRAGTMKHWHDSRRSDELPGLRSRDRRHREHPGCGRGLPRADRASRTPLGWDADDLVGGRSRRKDHAGGAGGSGQLPSARPPGSRSGAGSAPPGVGAGSRSLPLRPLRSGPTAGPTPPNRPRRRPKPVTGRNAGPLRPGPAPGRR